MRAVLRFVAKFLPCRRIVGGDKTLYLSRYTVLRIPFTTRSVYLHCFHRSDEDRDLHNHPWDKSVSLVLWGGYVEERRVQQELTIPHYLTGLCDRRCTVPCIDESDEHGEGNHAPGCAFRRYRGVPDHARLVRQDKASGTYAWSEIEEQVVLPGSLNRIDADTFHRVDLLKDEAWTLFFTGKHTQSWGFWDRNSDCFVHYETYLRNKGLEPVENDH